MPGFVDPNEAESRQNLYRDLLSHLNTTIWGSPSTLDNLNPIKTIGETYSELTYRPSEEELKANSIDYGPEGKTLPKTIAGKLSRLTRKFTLDQLYSGANALERAYEGRASMQDATEAALTALSGGTLGGGTGVANQIRGVPKDVAKAIRKVMQNEIKVRGKAPYGKTSGSTEAQAYTEELAGYKKMQSDPETFDFDAPEPEIFHKNVLESEESVASRLLRGTWYRGQEEYPKILGKEKVVDPAAGKEVEELVTRQFGKEYAGEAPTYMGMRASSSNVGEPHGISLSYEPRVSARFNAPETLDADKLHNVKTAIEPYRVYGSATGNQIKNRASKLASTTKVGRAMPLYGGPPEDRILMAWKPEHGAEFRSAYVEAAQEMAGKYPGFKRKLESLEPGASGESVKNMIDYDPNKDAWQKNAPLQIFNTERYKSNRDEFNSIMSRILRERGWKGMLHSPHRYQEYELRMFDPYDVMHIDKRAVAKYSADNPMQSQAVQRLRDMKDPLKREHEAVTSGKPRSLGEFYRDITREELLGLPKLTRDPRAVALEEYKSEILKDMPAESNTYLTKDWHVLPKDDVMQQLKWYKQAVDEAKSGKDIFTQEPFFVEEDFKLTTKAVEDYYDKMNKYAMSMLKQDKIKKAQAEVKANKDAFDLDMSDLKFDDWKELSTLDEWDKSNMAFEDLVKSYNPYAPTKLKAKSVNDKLDKMLAKAEFKKKLGHNAEINDFEEVWESFKELGNTKTSFKDFISDW